MTTVNGHHTDTYFANLPANELCSSCMDKVDDYYQYLIMSGRLAVWRRSYEAFYRGIFRGGKMTRSGEQGEYTLIGINHYRNLLMHLKNMTTQQLPALTPMAANTDYTSMAQTIVASGILDYYLTVKEIADSVGQSTEDALVFGNADLAVEWDVNDGEDYGADPETGKVYKTGDISIHNYTPLDSVVDFQHSDAVSSNWKIVRQFVNKYDLMAKYPIKVDQIRNSSMDITKPREQRMGYASMKDTDLITLWKFYHKKTESVPNGRYMEFISTEDWLFDGPLPYKDIPIYRITPAEQRGTVFGYTIAFDLLPIQDAVDGLYSTIVTNQQNFGVQNVLMPMGSGISVESLNGGLNLISYDPKAGKPESLNLTNTPAEIFKFVEMLEHVMETISGVNSVARGNPEASLKSGAALALVQSMAIQFNSGLQQSYAKLWSEVGTAIIRLLKTFPQTKRNIVVAGKDNRSYMAEFGPQDIQDIDRVVVDLGNPLTRTTAGKVNMADNLLQRNMIQEPEQYIQVITTGRIEPIYQGKQAEVMLIRAENEKLMDGIPQNAIATDKHSLHMIEHKTVLASPESRQNPQTVNTVLTHIQQHIQLLRTSDPALLAAVGEQQIPPAPNQQPPVTPGAEPNGQQPGPNGNPGQKLAASEIKGSQGAALSPQSPIEQQAANVKGPQMPKNPLTKQEFNPVTGGL